MMNDPPEQPRRNEPARQPRGASVQRLEVATWQGPIPPPATLREIDDIVPGAAEKIINGFVAEGEHRRAMERRSQWLPFWDQAFARVCGLLFAAGCLVLIGYAISVQAYWAAAVLSAAMVVGGINAIMSKAPARLPRQR